MAGKSFNAHAGIIWPVCLLATYIAYTVSHCGEGGEDEVEANQLHTTTVSTRGACLKYTTAATLAIR